MKDGHPGDHFLKELTHKLEEHFRVSHTTIQIELGNDHGECALAPEHVV